MNVLSILSVQWWALLIGVVVSFINGMLWFGPLFGKVWMKLIGMTTEEIEGGQSPWIYIGTAIVSLLSTYIFGVILNIVDTQTIGAAIGVNVLLWFCFRIILNINLVIFEGRSLKLILINDFNILVNVIIMSIVLQLAR